MVRCPFIDPESIFTDLAATRLDGGLPWSPTYAARLVTRYDDVVAVLHDAETYSSEPTVGQVPSPWREQFVGRVPSRGTLLGIDNPDHDRLRSSVNTFFMPRRLVRYESWIRDEANRLIDGFIEQGESDLKTAFALPLPLRVIAHVVGLDPARADWIGESLGFFLGSRDIHHAGTPDEKAQKLLALHDYVLDVMAQRKTDRRDDLISHVWNCRDDGTVTMTDFEMLSMFPGLMLAGHETTSNLICMLVAHLLSEPGCWGASQRDDDSRSATLEEMFRFESAITGMKRLVTRDTELGGVALRAGEQVFLAYAAGSRDPAVFGRPEEFDTDRGWARPHLGFGQGVHACLGAPLARLLLRIELEVLHERLPDLRLAVPYTDLRHTEVAEGRGMVSLPLAWSAARPLGPARTEPTRTSHPVEGSRPEVVAGAIPVTVTDRRTLTADVIELTLRTDRRDDHPEWQPGAHIDLELPDGAIRQYSLCGRPSAEDLRIAVLREPLGRGGSRAVHDQITPGDRLRIRGPRNHFGLRAASFYLFVAGGIGITPLLPMIEAAAASDVPWRLLYLARSTDRMPYLDDLKDRYRGRVYDWPSRERGRYDLDEVWARLPQSGAYVYACGPEQLLNGLEDSARRHGHDDRLIVERFAARSTEHEPNRAIEVLLSRLGRSIVVDTDETILDAVNAVGASVLSTCREGTCGTCEVGVLDGVPEHRDSVLSLEERLIGRSIMTCVSRCRGARLVLDL